MSIEPGQTSVGQPLEWLPRRRQIHLMRGLASAALAAYDLSPARLSLLKHRHNTTFLVDPVDRPRCVLRIHRSGTPTVEGVSAELEWLRALRRDTALQVPNPVLTRDGSSLTVAETSALRAAGFQPHICVLFDWSSGRMLDAGLAPVHMTLAGELMGRLQNHAAGWRPAHPLARGRVDGPIDAARRLGGPFAQESVFAQASVDACRGLVASTLGEAEAKVVGAVVERVRAAEEALGQGPAVFGLIHADLHHHNLLFERHSVRAIDFDDCGFGPFLYDLAVPLAVLRDHPAYPALRAGLLAGYRRVRPLPLAREEYLDTFIALRLVQDALWVLAARRHPAIAADWVAQARRILAPLADFLTGGGHFPEHHSAWGWSRQPVPLGAMDLPGRPAHTLADRPGREPTD